MLHRVNRLALFALASAFALLAQRGGGTAGTGTTGNTGNTGGRAPIGGTPQPGSQPPSQQPQVNQPSIPIFMYGKVVMDDGTPPPANIAIKRVCSNNPHTVAFTSTKGQFSFSFGDNTPQAGVFDASEGLPGRGGVDNFPGNNSLGGNQSTGRSTMGAAFIGCELIADLPGYRSDRLNLAGRTMGDNPDVGMIVLHRLANVEGTAVSATSLNAPKDARKAWEKGVQLMHQAKSGTDPKLASAQKELENAVSIYPKFANAWSDLGHTRLLRQDTAGAREAYAKALEADAKLVEPYVALGEQDLRNQDWQNAAQHLDKALQLDPVDYPRLWLQDAVANYNVQNFDRAERGARETLKLPAAQSDPHAHEILGLILLNRRDYAGAKESFNAYIKAVPAAAESPQVKAALAQIDSEIAAADK